MLRRIVTLISVGLITVVNADTDRLEQIQKSLDNIMAKAGISFGGEFKSQYHSSRISGPGSDSLLRAGESNEYTSVDFDIKARPNEYVSGRLIFRMHQNWQNFFSDISNPIFSRWISIDGNPLDMFRFSIGDYKERYSPLTLYSPDIDIMFEPYIFARERQIAMDEVFVGNNNRILQGINFGFDAEIVPIFNEFHFGISGARLRSTGTNTDNGSQVVAVHEENALKPMSNYYVGTNLDMVFLKGVSLGGTFMTIFDHKGSYEGSDTTADTLRQLTFIRSFRPGVDIASLIGLNALTLKVDGEFASSVDDSTWFLNSENAAAQGKNAGFYNTGITGSALSLGVQAGYSLNKAFSFVIGGQYIKNDEDFRNELAQSPSFVPTRIMNLENDREINTPYGRMLNHYTTFDALYHSVFKFVPTGEKVNRWDKAPFMKNSYRRTILAQEELAEVIHTLDPALQLVMPFGPATPNRKGISADLTAAFINNGIELKGLFSALEEENPGIGNIDGQIYTLLPTEFQQLGVGLKINIQNLAKMKYPLEISTSWMKSGANNDGIAGVDSPWEIESIFQNVGLYWKFFKRAALLGGLQTIYNRATLDALESEQRVLNWAAGLEWKVSDGADVLTTVGQIVTLNDEDNTSWPLSGAVSRTDEFKQLLLNVSLRVKF